MSKESQKYLDLVKIEKDIDGLSIENTKNIIWNKNLYYI
jgi:5,10-methylene-tetrahydrofolate dehydrogenase/methenyl tetrahydrofolate cyclohydrolase